MKSTDVFKTAAFTGHRTEKLPWKNNENSYTALSFKRHLKSTLEELIVTGCINFLSGAARGFDTIAAEAVLELREEYPWISLTVVLPCENQAEKWSNEDKVRWEYLIEKADHVLHLGGEYDKGCMFRRNRYLVDNASLLIAAYDDSGIGGTAMTLAYAAEKGRTIIRMPLTDSTVKDNTCFECVREIA